MQGYVKTKHPITGRTIQIVPTGKTNGSQAEFLVITPGSNLTKVWLKREEIS